jgi:hypothetical protein
MTTKLNNAPHICNTCLRINSAPGLTSRHEVLKKLLSWLVPWLPKHANEEKGNGVVKAGY